MNKNKFLYSFLVISFLTIGCFVYVMAQEPKPLLHFVQISDTHLQKSIAKDAERLLGSSEKLLTDAVAQINEIKDLNFVLSTGDNVDTAEEKLLDKYIEITMSLKYPFYVLFGNHDVTVMGALNKENYIKKFNTLENPTSFTNEMTYYSFSPNEMFTVICLDGTTEELITAHGQLDEKQYEWLKEELEKNKEKFVIIALHFPLIEPYKSQTHFFLEPDRTKLLELLDSYKNVIGVFTGHYHAARLTKIKNKIHNSNPAVVQWPNAFREIIITQPDKKHLELEFKWHVVNGKELREKSKISSKAWALTEGAPEDREQVIRLKVY